MSKNESSIANDIANCFNSNSGIMLKDQKIPIKSKRINELITKYGNKKTNLNLIELLSPSGSSRAKNQPRPQNPFILFRRNFSKGLKLAKISIGTGPSSTIASEQWKLLSIEENEFWKKLSIIAKEMHEESYPNYKYNPIKSQEKVIEKTKQLINLNDVIENIKSTPNTDMNASSSENPDLADLSSNTNEANDVSINNHPITELIDNFYEPMDIDIQYNPQDFLFKPTDSLLYQDELNYNLNFYDPLIDPTLFSNK